MSSENRNPLLRIGGISTTSSNQPPAVNLTRDTLYTVWSRIQNLPSSDRETVLNSLARSNRIVRSNTNISNNSESEDEEDNTIRSN
jgi:hypothetical protein